MSTLAEIADAADPLSSEDKQAWRRFLAARLREQPAPMGHSRTRTGLMAFAGSLRPTENPLRSIGSAGCVRNGNDETARHERRA